MPVVSFFVSELTFLCYRTLVLGVGRIIRLMPAIILAVRGGVVFPQEHNMSIISSVRKVKGHFSTFAFTSRFHGPPGARFRFA
ncbi:hypothetical protein K9857_14555 [Pseudomonas sp. REP124]|uniref:hypothetical protein n=1 Tax=Pseudomonas sp. REP124 TaxID=2875731 RepID=UPI001CCF3BB0|nr:hypothetical protein [Pseudomonas sp. REP124]MBZ9782762.1 hypothetical protein [Pseudomonas sp. REP124]